MFATRVRFAGDSGSDACVATSTGWVAAVAAFLALAVTGTRSDDARTLEGVYPAMDVVVTAAIVPLALAALVTGIVQGVGTPWGLFRHYWVVIKLVVTVVATVVLVQELGPIERLADLARAGDLGADTARSERMSLVVHSGGGLLTLLVPMVLSIYKPRGLTRYGRRKLAKERAAVPVMDSDVLSR